MGAVFICPAGMMRIRLGTILFGAFPRLRLANMYTIDCASPAKNHPKISCSEVSEIPRCQGGSASFPQGMPSERHTDASRNDSFRRVYARLSAGSRTERDGFIGSRKVVLRAAPAAHSGRGRKTVVKREKKLYHINYGARRARKRECDEDRCHQQESLSRLFRGGDI